MDLFTQDDADKNKEAGLKVFKQHPSTKEIPYGIHHHNLSALSEDSLDYVYKGLHNWPDNDLYKILSPAHIIALSRTLYHKSYKKFDKLPAIPSEASTEEMLLKYIKDGAKRLGEEIQRDINPNKNTKDEYRSRIAKAFGLSAEYITNAENKQPDQLQSEVIDHIEQDFLKRLSALDPKDRTQLIRRTYTSLKSPGISFNDIIPIEKSNIASTNKTAYSNAIIRYLQSKYNR